MINLQIVQPSLKKMGEKYLGLTQELQKDLASNGVKAAAVYLGPVGAEALAGANELVTIAIVACQGAIKIADNRGVTARLQALASDLTAAEHASNKHSIGFYVELVQHIWNDAFGSNATGDKTPATPVVATAAA